MEKERGKGKSRVQDIEETLHEIDNPTTMKGDEKMSKGFRNFQVKDIKDKFLAPMTKENPDGGWTISEIDQMAIDAVEHVPLPELLDGHTTTVKVGKKDVTTPTLSLFKGVVVLRHTDKKKKGGQTATKSVHLWQREEWMKLLPEAGLMIRVKKPNQKKGEWVLLDTCPAKDLEWRQKNVLGNFLPSDKGFVIPSIGGLNFKTGELENVPTEPIVVNSIELHHRWHTTQERTDIIGKNDSTEVRYCLEQAQTARDAGNDKAAQTWEDKADHFRRA